jgi:N-acetylglutamate synthase-like GNAT family acetyltransferase
LNENGNKPVTIEVYSDINQNAIAELILSIQNDEFGIPISLEQQPDLIDVADFYQTGRGNFWIAKAGDIVLGTIALLDIGNDQAALRKMFVHQNYRGKAFGIGQKLLDHLLIWAEQKELKEIYLGTTEKFIAAQRFYEKNGFQEIRKNDLPPAFPAMAVDVKFYKITTAVHL